MTQLGSPGGPPCMTRPLLSCKAFLCAIYLLWWVVCRRPFVGCTGVNPTACCCVFVCVSAVWGAFGCVNAAAEGLLLIHCRAMRLRLCYQQVWGGVAGGPGLFVGAGSPHLGLCTNLPCISWVAQL